MTLKFVQSVIKIREVQSLTYILEIDVGGFISSKDGHNEKESSGMIAQVVPEVNSSMIVVPQ